MIVEKNRGHRVLGTHVWLWDALSSRIYSLQVLQLLPDLMLFTTESHLPCVIICILCISEHILNLKSHFNRTVKIALHFRLFHNRAVDSDLNYDFRFPRLQKRAVWQPSYLIWGMYRRNNHWGLLVHQSSLLLDPGPVIDVVFINMVQSDRWINHISTWTQIHTYTEKGRKEGRERRKLFNK